MPGHGIRLSQLVLLATSLVAVTLLAAFNHDISNASLRTVASIMLAGELALGTLIARVDERGVWGFPFLFYIILVIFHSGLYLAPALMNQAPLSLTSSDVLWYLSPQIERAGYLVSIGLACYAFGFSIASIVPSGKRAIDSEFANDSESARTRDGIVDVGGAVVLTCVVVWFTIGALTGGPLFFIGSYLTFLQGTEGSLLPWVYLGISMGLTMCSLDLTRTAGRIGVAAFAIFSIPAFVLGLRGEVLFPAVAALAVAGARRKVLSTRTFLVTCLLALLAISFVGQVRVAGLSSIGSSNVVVSPVRAIEEMGYSVRPLTASIQWHEAGHEPYLLGSTYTGPFDRQIQGMAGQEVPDATRDPRLMNVEIAERVGNIGGSIIAEAHHNWGSPGVGAILLATGFLVGRMFRRGMGPVGIALSGDLSVLLLMHVRNSFAPLPGWGAVGVLLVFTGVFVGKLHSRATRSRQTSHAPTRKGAT